MKLVEKKLRKYKVYRQDAPIFIREGIYDANLVEVGIVEGYNSEEAFHVATRDLCKFPVLKEVV
jgi:hypothetical protein